MIILNFIVRDNTFGKTHNHRILASLYIYVNILFMNTNIEFNHISRSS